MFEGIFSLLNKLPGGSGQPYKPPQSQTQAVPQPDQYRREVSDEFSIPVRQSLMLRVSAEDRI